MKFTVTFCILLAVAPSFLMGSPPAAKNTFCKEKENGFYGNAYNCQYYYECQNRATRIRRCHEDLKFDVSTKSCLSSQLSNCLTSRSECIVDCTGHNHGDLFPNPEDCGSFYQCSWGVAYLQQCPRGLVFNPIINVCDWPENVDCGSILSCEDRNSTTTERPIPTNSTSRPTNAPTTGSSGTNRTTAVTARPTTTERTTTQKPTTTKKPTTEKPTTTKKPTTEKPTTTKKPTTQKPTTTKKTTTQKPTTTKKTTTKKPPASSEENDSNSNESSDSSSSSSSSESNERFENSDLTLTVPIDFNQLL